jgi:hypothetical protein
VRIEVPEGPRFGMPYFVLLVCVNPPDGTQERENGNETWLKIKHHTIPEAIPLAALARKYLPGPNEKSGPKSQNLQAFVRALRKDITSWHMRQQKVARLCQKANVDPSGVTQAESEMPAIVSPEKRYKDITGITADIDMHELGINWNDGTRARLRLSESGHIETVAVRGANASSVKRRKMAGGESDIEEILERIITKP